MPPTFIPSIDLKKYSQDTSGLKAKDLAYFNYVLTEIDPRTIELGCAYLARTFGSLKTIFDVSDIQKAKPIVQLLDAGAAGVVVSLEQYGKLRNPEDDDDDDDEEKEEKAMAKVIDFSRVVVAVSVQNATAENLATISSQKLLLTNVKDKSEVKYVLEERDPHDLDTYVSYPLLTRQLVDATAQMGAIPIVPAYRLSVESPTPSEKISAAELLLVRATTDRPDGLYPTLVADERGVPLGLVYSSKESLSESLSLGRGVYQSRKRGLWYKGESSGDTQELVSVAFDCDADCLTVRVRQAGRGFCHLGTATCFGDYTGLSKLQQTLQSRKQSLDREQSADSKSYTLKLFKDPKYLTKKLLEEVMELIEAKTPEDIAAEAADVMYFVLTRCVASGVSLLDVENNLDAKSMKILRREGNAKPDFIKTSWDRIRNDILEEAPVSNGTIKEAASVPKAKDDPAGIDASGRIKMTRYMTSEVTPEVIADVLKRPSQRSTDAIMGIVKPIIEDVRTGGDKALLSYTHKFEKATSLTSPVLRAPYPESLRKLDPETAKAIDVSFENIKKFHAAQHSGETLSVETMPGVVCSRFSRPIERVGLYVPGGTAVLPSTALMLGVPAMVAGCKTIVLASPPRADGSLTPEIVYVAHKIGAESIVLAGGAQAVAALAYGTESISKVDKILGPGNQFVTAGKMLVSNDTSAGVSIDMPAGPSEVLVVADKTSNPAFVASDLLSQAEHGVDSQVILIAVDLGEAELAAIEDELHAQATALPRVDIVRGAIDHSVTLCVKDIEEAMTLSNLYAPEHLILQVEDADAAAKLVENAGSVFIGPWTPESVGDYSAGVNHSLPTYGYARQYSGVNLGSYLKHITSSRLTEQGLRNVGGAVMQLAKVEELEAHRRAVSIRLAHLDATAKV